MSKIAKPDPRDYAIVGKAEVMQIVMGGQPKAVAA